MKKLKHILALALCLCIALSAVTITRAAEPKTDMLDTQAFTAYAQKARQAFTQALERSSAAEVEAQGSVNFHYVTQGSEAMISGVENCPGVLNIPETIDGYTVVSIGDEAFKNKSMYEVYLPRAVRYVGISAFASCKNLHLAVLPDGLKQIDHNAFDDCPQLSYVGTAIYAGSYVSDVSIYMPTALDYLGVCAFCDCPALVGMVFRQNLKEIPEYTFARCQSMEVLVSYADTVGRGAFNRSSIDLFMQLNVLKKVGSAAFQNAETIGVLYSGSKAQFLKKARGLTVYDGVYALGADVQYKSSGKLSNVIDREIINEIREYSTVNAFSCDDASVLRIGADGDSYEAGRVGQTLLRHPYYDLLNEYSDPDDDSADSGFPPTPAYVTVSYAWWQQLIRVLLFGWIWY